MFRQRARSSPGWRAQLASSSAASQQYCEAHIVGSRRGRVVASVFSPHPRKGGRISKNIVCQRPAARDRKRSPPPGSPPSGPGVGALSCVRTKQPLHRNSYPPTPQKCQKRHQPCRARHNTRACTRSEAVKDREACLQRPPGCGLRRRSWRRRRRPSCCSRAVPLRRRAPRRPTRRR